mmetsp:Transcript_41016/g.92025  ORF Transcript_41016/g.92025 Transcript_41016/m.92025 type:complete len:832 (+) Transcript_41016:42-2537(+)
MFVDESLGTKMESKEKEVLKVFSQLSSCMLATVDLASTLARLFPGLPARSASPLELLASEVSTCAEAMKDHVRLVQGEEQNVSLDSGSGSRNSIDVGHAGKLVPYTSIDSKQMSGAGEPTELQPQWQSRDKPSLRPNRISSPQQPHHGDVQAGVCDDMRPEVWPCSLDKLIPRFEPGAELAEVSGLKQVPDSMAVYWWNSGTPQGFLNKSETEDMEGAGSMVGIHRKSIVNSHDELARYGDTRKESAGNAMPWVLHPASAVRVLFDFLSLLAITWDLCTLPLVVFTFNDLPVARVMRVATALYWSVELPMPFFVGYYDKEGQVEMRMLLIGSRYVRTWFLPQLCVVVLDLTLLIIGAESTEVVSLARVSKMARVVRVARIFRFVRIMRFVSLLEDMSDLVFSEMLRALLAVCNMLFAVGLICHYIACSWYWMGIWSERHDESSWIHSLDAVDAGELHRYLVCFHWAWAQFTPAPPPAYSTPVNLMEEVFAVFLLFFGLVMFSSFVGSVTATITNARKEAEERKLEAVLLRRYFRENRVSIRTGSRIVTYVKMQQHKRVGVLETDVIALRHLPHTLMNSLRVEVYEPVLSMHPLFRSMKQMHAATLQKICTLTLNEVVLGAGDEVIHYGKPAHKMFFIRKGAKELPATVMEFYPGPLFSCSQRSRATISTGSWCCEVALWLAAAPPQAQGLTQEFGGAKTILTSDEFEQTAEAWKHRGRIVVTAQCGVVELDASRFRVATMEHPLAIRDLRKYAHKYIDMIGEELSEWIDVWGSSEQITEILEKELGWTVNRQEETWKLWRSSATGYLMKSFSSSDDGRTGCCGRSCRWLAR